jgi:uncharacterized protein (DUF2141 family)
MSKHWISGVLLLALVSAGAETLTVNVTTEGPREGVIDILVFNGTQGFPNKPEKAFRRVRVPVTAEDPVACAITNLPYGSYSLSVLHDINVNNKADKMLGFGPPREPVGFSNIPLKMRKQPSYKATVFTFNAQTSEIAVAVWYVL